MKWEDQYKHPEWQKKRLQILERDGFKCRKCGDTEKQLHVHHLLYEKGKRVWEYDANWKLITLCESCHKNIHEFSAYINEMVARSYDEMCCPDYCDEDGSYRKLIKSALNSISDLLSLINSDEIYFESGLNRASECVKAMEDILKVGEDNK